MSIPLGLGRLYNARPSNIPPFCERIKSFLVDSNIFTVQIHPTSVFTFPPWDVQRISYINPFLMYDKSTTAPIVFQQIFLYHRHQYNTYIPIFTDGSKTANRVDCGVVVADVTSSFQLNALCSVLTAELTAIFLALERISDLLEHKFCVYSDSKSALEALSHPQNGTHPLALDILCLLQSFQARDFQILFCWLPGRY
ncbi:hypothetical protein AVEN_194434-1 [Araneus ventricosus]|uniref:Uncharacterized protein n=1 Tax=Araneus ventricosus TaxID=182803 RepID=A0A4Y2A5X0_ARAVE|nr:hypothetical protein AVEN_194434-1 [Araneus ventricosus]